MLFELGIKSMFNGSKDVFEHLLLHKMLFKKNFRILKEFNSKTDLNSIKTY